MEYLEKFEVILLLDTWIEEKRAENIKSKLSKKYTWKVLNATRKKQRGRASGGMLIGTRKELNAEIEAQVVNEKSEICKVKLQIEEKKWTIMSVYMGEDNEEMWDKLDGITDKEKEVIITWDFNARIGKGAGLIIRD